MKKEMDARTVLLDEDESKLINDLPLLTFKKVIYAANLAEDELSDSSNNPYFQKLTQYAAEQNCLCIPVSAKIEEEIAHLSDEEKELFLQELGVSKSGLSRLIEASYALLGLISFLTAGEKEVRAWTITKGTKAIQAAGKIHSDFERGFIRAEVIAYDDLIACGSMQSAREKGLVRSEGKDYIMQDGDVVLFRFNV